MVAVSSAAEPQNSGFFSRGLAAADPEIAEAINEELNRQREKIELIASENIVSRAVLEAGVGAGAVDGVTALPTPTVDGLAWPDYWSVPAQIGRHLA